MGQTRDYYADLELPAGSDIQEVKKQFRKLALKYHPDRNPGREVEVNSRFQIIQSAHEVLGDPQQKAKYDATLGRSGRYTGASGVKGNPWADAAKDFPPPPRRTPAGRAGGATSGAQRWQSRFASGVPPTAKQYTSADSETKKNAARAFENMRKSQSEAAGKKKAQARPNEPPPPPPRTTAAKQRAEASFGNRKPSNSSRPAASAGGPAAGSGTSRPRPDTEYFETNKTQQSRPVPDPLSQFREQAAYADSRQSTPYMSHGGEKFNPFDGVPQRTKSGRENQQSQSSSHGDQNDRSRSSSAPRQPRRDDGSENLGVPAGEQRPSTGGGSAGAFAKSSFKERTGSNNTDSNQDGDGPSMYARNPNNPAPCHFTSSSNATPFKSTGTLSMSSSLGSLSSVYSPSYFTEQESGQRQSQFANLSPFEWEQHQMLNKLIRNRHTNLPSSASSDHSLNSNKERNTNKSSNLSFSFPVDDDTFTTTSPNHANFGRNSAEDINTKFSAENDTGPWKFKAGSDSQSDLPQQTGPFSFAGSTKTCQNSNADGTDQNADSETTAEGFNARGWSNKFGPQTFVPQRAPSASASPTRATRTNSRRAKTTKPTAGTAAVVDDSDDDIYEWNGRKPQTQGVSVDSPQAMDIDSPPAVPPSRTNSARNIHVEPSRPEWRSGDVHGRAGNSTPNNAEKEEKSPTNAGGSEDTAEFRASLADLKNVEPFTQPKAGLKSFGDLKDNLPFESKASGDVGTKYSKPGPLVFPTPPTGPRLPPTVAIDSVTPSTGSWERYLQEFESYMREWETFNQLVVDHFATRNSHIARIRASKGYAFLGARNETDVQEYFSWVQQDNDVRRRWNAACDMHEERFREFMMFRERMK